MEKNRPLPLMYIFRSVHGLVSDQGMPKIYSFQLKNQTAFH